MHTARLVVVDPLTAPLAEVPVFQVIAKGEGHKPWVVFHLHNIGLGLESEDHGYEFVSHGSFP